MHHAHDSKDMQACIDACLACYRTCQEQFATHCLEMGGKHVAPEHARLMLSCAEVCRTSAHLMLTHSPVHKLMCGVCAKVCRECARDCREVGDMDACVSACDACAASCEAMSAT